MKTEEELIEIADKIDKLLLDSDLTWIEIFGLLESCKGYFLANLIQKNIKPGVVAVKVGALKQIMQPGKPMGG